MKYGKKIAAFAVTAAVAATGLSAFAIESTNPETNGNKSAYDTWAADWATQKLDYSSVSITPGATASELNFAWYAETAPAAKVKIATNKEMTENVKTFDENGSCLLYTSPWYRKSPVKFQCQWSTYSSPDCKAWHKHR